MKRLAYIVLFALAPLAAQAQGAPPQSQQPPYAPVTLTESDWNSVQSYLAEQPYKMSAPLLEFLGRLEARAQMQATTEAAQRKAAAVKPTVPPSPPKPNVPIPSAKK
jgi:hypothetical protein